MNACFSFVVNRQVNSQPRCVPSVRLSIVKGVVLAALALSSATAARAATITFQDGVAGYSGTRDVLIGAGQGEDPDTNAGLESTLRVFERETSLNNFYRALVGFDLSSLTPNTHVTSATLTLYVANTGDGFGSTGVTNSLYLVSPGDSGWTQTGASWNNQNATTAWVGNTAPVHAPNPQPEDATNSGGLVADVDYNATAISTATTPLPLPGPVYDTNAPMTLTLDAAGIAAIQDWIDNPSDNSGFFLRQPSASFSVDQFWSSRASDTSLRPLLTLTATIVPEPSSYALLALGMAGLWAVRRRQKIGC